MSATSAASILVEDLLCQLESSGNPRLLPLKQDRVSLGGITGRNRLFGDVVIFQSILCNSFHISF